MFYVSHEIDDDYDVLIDKTITKIYVNDSRDRLTFLLADGSQFTLVAYGDCCSTSWFENFTFTALPAVVRSVDDGHYQEHAPVAQSRHYDDKIDVSIIKFVTTTGYWDLELRNASNGYYSGWVEVKHRAAVRSRTS